MSGKVLRLKRFIDPHDGRIVILPMDHGVSCGPIPGLETMADAIRMGVQGGADALVLHKGMFRYLEGLQSRLPGIFLHLSASTQLGPAFHRKVLVGDVEEGLRRGADGVSLHINLGDLGEPDMLEDFGQVAGQCAAWQVPLLVMVYVRGAHAPSPVPDSALAHAARIAAELGADIIKMSSPKDPDVLARITANSSVPVVVAGGSKAQDTHSFLQRIEVGLASGIKGVAVGRNVFQHERPQALLRAIRDMVHNQLTADQAMARLDAAGNPSR